MKLQLINEMPLHSFHYAGHKTAHQQGQVSKPLLSKNYGKALIKFMTKFPGPDWIVIVGTKSYKESSSEMWIKYLLDKGIPQSKIDSSILFLHDGLSNADPVTPWILVHNFAHAIRLDGMSHIVYPLLDYETELNDIERNRHFRKGVKESPSERDEDILVSSDEREFIRPGIEQTLYDVAWDVRQDLLFKSAQQDIDPDELVCELFVEFMKHNGHIRSKANDANYFDYTRVEQFFHKLLNKYTGKLVVFEQQ